MKQGTDLQIKIFADGADRRGMFEMNQNPQISGFTTNPTLMKQAGVSHYEEFAKDILKEISDKSVSFEVFADDFAEMERQALKIQSWGRNVYVKIPVTNTKGEPTYDLIERLSEQQVQLNITAIFTLEQVREVALALASSPAAIISVFAGRIADAGVDPLPLMQAALALTKLATTAELLWASTREPFNILQADAIGCHIITVPNAILGKMDLFGKDLNLYSLETVKSFYQDATLAGFQL